MLGFGNNTPVDTTAPKKVADRANDPCCDDGDKSATTKHFAKNHSDFEGV